MCRVLGVSRSGFYAFRTRSESDRVRDDRRLLAAITASHQASRKTYGAPRVLEDLRESGWRVSRKRVQRLMRRAGLRASRPRRWVVTTDSRHTFTVARNLLARDFSVESINQKWACDITFIPTTDGWLYLAVVLDLCSRRVVGHAMATSLRRSLVEEALVMAQQRRRPAPGLVHHSDRGSQYASTDYQELLHRAGLICSMSRKGDCWDNAPVESFFATLKKELVHRGRFSSRSEARTAIFHYIEAFYNVRRKHSSLGYLSPAGFEAKLETEAKVAA